MGRGAAGDSNEMGGELNLEQPKKVDNAEDIRPMH